MADIKFPTQCAMVNIDILEPYTKNPKNHTDKDISLIIKSIERNGWGDPLLVCPETKEVLSGNGRLQAAIKMGLQKVPVVYAPEGLTDKQKADLVIASNKLVEVSGYNSNLEDLIAEFELEASDFGVDLPNIDVIDSDDEEETIKNVEKKLCQCPVCGHINEEKAFKYNENS